MSFKSTLKLDSRFFSRAERQKAFGSVASQSAETFRRSLQQKMIDSRPGGRIVSVGSNRTFQTRFQRSKRGQRPAIQTRKLIESIKRRRVSDTSSSVVVLAEYGQTLQDGGRQVMTATDVAEAEQVFIAKGKRAFLDLL